MKVLGLDGSEYNWIIKPNIITEEHKSKYHIRARYLLKKLFPFYKVIEEIKLPGLDLYLDFYIPGIRLAIEVNGDQHYNFIPFFHGTRNKFFKSQDRDKIKEDWCLLNKICLVVLNTKDTDLDWMDRINGRIRN